MITESLAAWTGIIVAVCTIAAFATTSIRWLVKHYLNELKPNGGGSLKDSVNRLERDQQVLFSKIDDIYHVLLDHVAKHKD